MIATDASRLYCFDFDDTLAVTSSRILTKSGPLTSREYAERKSFVCVEDGGFSEFEDPEADLYPGPCCEVFLGALKSRSPIAVVTARSIPREGLKRMLSRLVDASGHSDLNPDYVQVYSCGSSDFSTEEVRSRPAGARKAWAVLDFLTRNPQAASIGFSDDDADNLAQVSELFEQIGPQFPRVRFRLYKC